MSGSGAAKLSISVPEELARSVRKRVGARGVSGFAARAMRHELEREQLSDYLKELEAERGPVSASVLDEVRRAWRKR
jgi:hypothetical protein